MKNGKYESECQREVIKQLKLLNAFLLDHTDHLMFIHASLFAMMIYLRNNGAAPKDAVEGLTRAFDDEHKRLRRRAQKTLRKAI